MDNFEDIINTPHHVSSRHKQMSVYARAAQFAPFAALTGYDDEIGETARLTDCFHVMTDDQTDSLDISFQKMLSGNRPFVKIKYFRPDIRKSGGAYEIYKGYFRFYDIENNSLKFTDGTVISADKVCEIEFDD